jgi:hypothetical protein
MELVLAPTQRSWGAAARRQSLRVAMLLVVIALLNCIDLVYTIFAHRQGLLMELNPIAANMFSMDAESSVICFKAMTVLLGSLIMWRLRYTPWVTGACWLVIAVYAGLAVRWWIWAGDFVDLMKLEQLCGQPQIFMHAV